MQQSDNKRDGVIVKDNPIQTNLIRYKKDIDKLLDLGVRLFADLKTQNVDNNKSGVCVNIFGGNPEPAPFREFYERWHTESYSLIKLLIPDRLDDFEQCYRRKKRKEIDYESYTISDFLIGLDVGVNSERVDGLSATIAKLNVQYRILESAKERFSSSLFDIKQIVQADLFDSEIDVAKELLKNGFLRAAGAVAGVVLEKHLKQVSENHNNKPKIAKPTLADYCQCLKDNDVIDQPTWRFIQHLADLRNRCVHYKEPEPKKEEVMDLIQGTDKIIKTVF